MCVCVCVCTLSQFIQNVKYSHKFTPQVADKCTHTLHRATHTSLQMHRSQPFACLSHRALSLMSQSLTTPLLVLYTKTLHCLGWNSAAVITSVRSSMLEGLMSTTSDKSQGHTGSPYGFNYHRFYAIFMVFTDLKPPTKILTANNFTLSYFTMTNHCRMQHTTNTDQVVAHTHARVHTY